MSTPPGDLIHQSWRKKLLHVLSVASSFHKTNCYASPARTTCRTALPRYRHITYNFDLIIKSTHYPSHRHLMVFHFFRVVTWLKKTGPYVLTVNFLLSTQSSSCKFIICLNGNKPKTENVWSEVRGDESLSPNLNVPF